MIQNLINLRAEIERVCLSQLLDSAKDFYSIAENQQAFENWKKSKEEKQNANYINTWFNRR